MVEHELVNVNVISYGCEWKLGSVSALAWVAIFVRDRTRTAIWTSETV